LDTLDKTPALTGSVETGKHKFGRQSNIELLRIVATFFILVLHANFQAFGAPSKSEIMDAPAASFLRFLVQAIAVVGVDVFILISGWFGIRPSWKSALNLAFQFFFFTVGIYAVAVGFGTLKFSKEIILNCFCLGHWNWFLRAYIGLFILAPVLNAFAETAPRRIFRMEVIAFFTFEIAYGWIARETQGFYKGQSTLSFIGLYLLARYVRRFRPSWSYLPGRYDFVTYAALAVAMTAGGLLSRWIGWKDGIHTIYSNASPLVIAASLFLLFGFLKLDLSSRFVNRVARSAYATYLVHTHPVVLYPLFIASIRKIPTWFGPLSTPVILFLMMLSVYALAALLDQFRIIAFSHVFSQKFQTES